jgi:hypothetical protein
MACTLGWHARHRKREAVYLLSPAPAVSGCLRLYPSLPLALSVSLCLSRSCSFSASLCLCLCLSLSPSLALAAPSTPPGALVYTSSPPTLLSSYIPTLYLPFTPPPTFLPTHTHTHTHTLSLSLSLTHTHTHTHSRTLPPSSSTYGAAEASALPHLDLILDTTTATLPGAQGRSPIYLTVETCAASSKKSFRRLRTLVRKAPRAAAAAAQLFSQPISPTAHSDPVLTPYSHTLLLLFLPTLA